MERTRPDLTLHRLSSGGTYHVGDSGLYLERAVSGRWGFKLGFHLSINRQEGLAAWMERHRLLTLDFPRRRDAMHYLQAILDTDPPDADFAPDHRMPLTWDSSLGAYKTCFNGKDWYLRRAARGWTWHASPDPAEKPVGEVRSLWDASHSQLLLTLADKSLIPTAVAL